MPTSAKHQYANFCFAGRRLPIDMSDADNQHISHYITQTKDCATGVVDLGFPNIPKWPSV
jgi:hypothetical protein